MAHNDVSSPSDEYIYMMENWQLTKTLMGGQRAMKLAGRLYLPQEPGESDNAYTIRLNRSVLYNKFKSSVKNLTGRLFSKPIALGDDMPSILVDYSDNIDLLGNNIDTFYREVVEDAFVCGLSHIYIDYPRMDSHISLEEELANDIRPYLVHIKASQLIKAVPIIINGKVLLNRVHIMENYEVPDGDWSTETRQQIRVLYPGAWELYRKNNTTSAKDTWTIVDGGETGLNYIPLVTFYGCKTGFMQGISPLQDLAYLNLGHWQSDSDQRNILHVARVPILFSTGLDENDMGKIELGANRMINAPDGADLKYVEHTGKSIEAGAEDLKTLEERMSSSAMEASQNSGPTKGGKAIDTSQANSSLQDLALRLQNIIEDVFDIMGEYAGLGKEASGSVVVSRDFGLLTREGSEPGQLLKAKQNGAISTYTYLREMKMRGILSEDTDIEEEMLRIDEDREKRQNMSTPYLNEDGKQVVGDDEEQDLDFGQERIE